ncbi:MAG: hypothetical protein WC527_01890 [Candidatus Margulisiibacteriota bacterium]
MPIETVQTILSIEARALEIVSSAERKTKLAINHAKEESAVIIAKTKEEGKSTISKMIEQSRLEAQKEKADIEKGCEESILAIRKRSSSKIDEAKKLCQ